MIAHSASHAPVPAPRPRIDREAFLDRHVRDQVGTLAINRTAGGFNVAGRAYVALRCGCVDARCPGWAVVHDDPADRAHFERLFGASPNADAGGQ